MITAITTITIILIIITAITIILIIIITILSKWVLTNDNLWTGGGPIFLERALERSPGPKTRVSQRADTKVIIRLFERPNWPKVWFVVPPFNHWIFYIRTATSAIFSIIHRVILLINHRWSTWALVLVDIFIFIFILQVDQQAKQEWYWGRTGAGSCWSMGLFLFYLLYLCSHHHWSRSSASCFLSISLPLKSLYPQGATNWREKRSDSSDRW